MDGVLLDPFFKTHPGIDDILGAACRTRIQMAVVSSNHPPADMRRILKEAGVDPYFHVVVGGDPEDLMKKPAPDIYRHAADRLGIAPENCVVVEGSVPGAEAGKKAGCFTIGVATGGTDQKTLKNSQWTDRVYTSFDIRKLDLAFGDVRAKRIKTPNDFVSHMVEHIAWRLGCSIDLCWQNDDWAFLGRTLGAHIRSFTPVTQSVAALGMMDDGSAETRIELGETHGLEISTGANIDMAWFLSLRCEQLSSGRDLVDLLTGLAGGISAKISLTVCNLEDPHHTWEGVFRAVGVALNKLFAPPVQPGAFSSPIERDIHCGDITIAARSGYLAEVKRHTAESGLSVIVDFEKQRPVVFQYEGAPIDHYRETNALEGFRELLKLVADSAGFSLQAVFRSKVLSSSHVLLEDTGMVIGKALREILVKRMMDLGINGAGSSLQRPADFNEQKINVGVSVEGRKFWRFVPLHTTYEDIKRRLIIGQTVMNGLFSEDLDDFLDGLSWGLGCSIVVHIKDLPPAEEAWRMIFENLGKALSEVFEINPYRKGVPPGVKANLS